MFNIGDFIYCHTTIGSMIVSSTWFTKGKKYKIIKGVDDDYIRMIDDEGDNNDIPIIKIYEYFYSKKEIRKQKLDKINESR